MIAMRRIGLAAHAAMQQLLGYHASGGIRELRGGNDKNSIICVVVADAGGYGGGHADRDDNGPVIECPVSTIG